VGIISPLHFDSKSMHFEVIIGSFFFSFIFPIAAFEKHLTDLWRGVPLSSPGSAPWEAPFVLLTVTWVS